VENEKVLIKNVADRKQVKEGSKKENRRRQRELDDLYNVMSTSSGRRLMYRIINELCHYDADDAMPSGSFTYKSLGERNIGRILKSDCIESSIELYQKSEQENWEFLNKE